MDATFVFYSHTKYGICWLETFNLVQTECGRRLYNLILRDVEITRLFNISNDNNNKYTLLLRKRKVTRYVSPQGKKKKKRFQN
jgi:hypothetical protein